MSEKKSKKTDEKKEEVVEKVEKKEVKDEKKRPYFFSKIGRSIWARDIEEARKIITG